MIEAPLSSQNQTERLVLTKLNFLISPVQKLGPMTMAIAAIKNTMTISSTMNDEWNSFTFTSYYKAPEDSWRCPLPPLVISKAYDEEQEKKRKEKIEFSRSLTETLTKMWEEEREARIQKKLADEEKEAKSKPKVEVVVEKKFKNFTFHKKPQKKVQEVVSNHNEARRAKKNEKKVLDKARAEFFQNSSLLFDDSWIISIGQALGMDKPQFHLREIKEKLNISMEKVKIVKPEDEISKEETTNLSEEQLESLNAEEKKDNEEIQIIRSKATEAIEVATVAYEAELKRKAEEAKELEIKKNIEKERIAELARAQAEIDLMTQCDFESKQLDDDDDYDLSAILKEKQKKLPFEIRFPIWKKVVVAPVIKVGAASVSEQANIVSATILKPKKNRLCRSLKLGSAECTNVNCPFLHSLKELKFNPCPYKKCGRVKLLENGKYKNIGVGCPFHHLNESPKDFFIRDGYLPVPEGHYDCPVLACPAITLAKASMAEAKVDVISCIAWKEANLKVLSYPEQKLEEVVVVKKVTREPVPEVVAPKSSTKTRMCDSVSSGHPCRHGEKCRFAHTINELVISSCQHGEKCLFVCNRKGIFYNSNGKFCKFIHPCESRENYFARNGIKVVEPVCTSSKTCTKVCNSVIQGFECRHKACNFAHSVEELNIRPCTFPNCKLIRVNSQGKVCNVDCRNRCSFFHEGETKESFFSRIVSKY
jgi:hypothetical protein